MADFKDILRGMGARVAQGLGLHSSDRDRLKKLRADLEISKAGHVDRWELIKEDVRKLEARLGNLKKEYEGCRGTIKKMVGQQIEDAFRQLDRKEKEIMLVRRNIEQVQTTLDRMRELEHVVESPGVTEGQLDDLAIQLEEGFDDARQTDKALADLNRVEYEAPAEEAVDFDKRLSELEEAPEPTPGMSAETAERLKQLEREAEE